MELNFTCCWGLWCGFVGLVSSGVGAGGVFFGEKVSPSFILQHGIPFQLLVLPYLMLDLKHSEKYK